MVQESQFNTSIAHWKSNPAANSDCSHKHHRHSYSMQAQLGANPISEPTYNAGAYPYSISLPSMYNQNSFPYSNNNNNNNNNNNSNSSNSHGLSHITSVLHQPYPGISMSSYPVEQNQYLSNIDHRNKLRTSGSSTAESNISNGSELDINSNPVKKRRKPAPTIATGRRNLKNETVAPEEAERRIKRRERNRKSAQRCRERKIEKKETLQKEINHVALKYKKYLVLAENIFKAWNERLRFLDDNLPGHNFQSDLSIVEFEQLIESCNSRNNNNDPSETGDTDSPKSSQIDSGSVMNSVKQEFSIAPLPISQNSANGNNNFMTYVKVEPYYQTSFSSDLLQPNIVNSCYHHYHHPYTNDSAAIGYN